MDSIKTDISSGLIFLLITVVLFLFAKVIKDLSTPYSINEELRTGNDAAACSLAGYFCATIFILLGAILGPSQGLRQDIICFIGYGFLGIVLLNISRLINDKIILYQFSNVKEIIEDRNAGTGAVEFGSYIASGLVVAGSIHGEGGGVTTALVFFLLSQLVLIIFSWLYNRLTPFDVHAEIERDNIAAGVAFGGSLVALGVILLKGAVGNFISWQYNLTNFAICVISGLILLPLIRLFFDKLILPGTNLNYEISHDQNLGLGILEMIIAILFAVVIFFVFDFHISQ